MQTIKPIIDHPRYSLPIAKEIYQKFYETIFAPLFAILEVPVSRQNASTSALVDALHSGRITYQNGLFIGPLNATISKQLRGIGAVYNKTRRAYALGPANLPQDIKLAIREGNEVAKTKLKAIEDFLDASEGRKIVPPNISPMFGDVVQSLDKQFHATTKSVNPSDIEIPLEPRFKDVLEVAYTANLDPYIQNWHDTQILTLRKKVQQNVSEGFRADKLADMIMSERGVSQRKAQFLARQETSLLVSKYRQIRYEEVDIKRYMWSTSHDNRVRHDHRELDGKVFSFDNPPVTDHHTMARNNPGEDFNCRCVAIPIMSNREALEREYVGV